MPVALLGSDMPHLPSSWVERAVQHRQADVVVGASQRWWILFHVSVSPFAAFAILSGAARLSQTLALALKHKLRALLLPVDCDVDTLAEWQELAVRVRSGEVEENLLPRTAWWEELAGWNISASWFLAAANGEASQTPPGVGG
ncbi:hypothetical protein IV102_23210 [bacterium]|nr:hypothetical protein [bacterium]